MNPKRRARQERSQTRANKILTPQQRIKALNKRLGKNKGAEKERERLNALMGGESQ